MESSRQIKGIVESAMDAIISVDAEQRIVVFNNAAEIMFRCAAREAIGSRIDRFIPQRFQAAHAGHIRSFWRMGETRRAIGSLSAISGLRADGEEFPIEAAISQTEAGGQPVFTVILRDITKRKQAEEALRISESRLRRFYESGLIGVIYWSTNGKITDANDKFLEMTGYDREDLAAGRLNWEQMTPPEFQYLDERALAEVKVTGIVSQPFEKEYIRKDGSRLPVLLAGAILDEVFQEGALSFWTPASARL
ncbi:MAG: PAS domain S-box protein [Methylobacter sp.]|nr:PAS domain S-box protein [Methylobacter sp.]